jgi:alkaline phosphatase D
MWTDALRAENPHYKWHNARRGYVVCRLNDEEWRTSYRTVPFVSRPGAPLQTPSEWLVRRRKPGLEKL